jgi:hypothetical protein
MLTQLTIAELQAKVEEQKRIALFGTVHVFCDSGCTASVDSACKRFSGLCNNPALFVTHPFTANLANATRDIASALPRVLLIAFFSSRDSASTDWVRRSFMQNASKIPYADSFAVDFALLGEADRPYIESLGVFHSPTVLTIKMGHVIDSFVPSQQRPAVLDQLAERDAKIRADLVKYRPPGVDTDQELRRTAELEKLEFEERERKKQEEKRRLEQVAQMKERARVKALIEKQKKDRRDGH